MYREVWKVYRERSLTLLANDNGTHGTRNRVKRLGVKARECDRAWRNNALQIKRNKEIACERGEIDRKHRAGRAGIKRKGLFNNI